MKPSAIVQPSFQLPTVVYIYVTYKSWLHGVFHVYAPQTSDGRGWPEGCQCMLAKYKLLVYYTEVAPAWRARLQGQ